MLLVSYLLRVSLPDRPGSLGELATSLGTAGIDINTVDVVERLADGTALDDVLVDLPRDHMPDSAVSACRRVPGVEVHYITPYPAGGNLSRDLEVVEAMTMDPDRAFATLVDQLPYLLRYGWSLLVIGSPEGARITQRSAGAPATTGFATPWLPLRRAELISVDESWAPSSWSGTTLAGAPIPGSVDPAAIVLGRPGGPDLLPSEMARLAHLTNLACTIVGQRGSGIPVVAG